MGPWCPPLLLLLVSFKGISIDGFVRSSVPSVRSFVRSHDRSSVKPRFRRSIREQNQAFPQLHGLVFRSARFLVLNYPLQPSRYRMFSFFCVVLRSRRLDRVFVFSHLHARTHTEHSNDDDDARTSLDRRFAAGNPYLHGYQRAKHQTEPAACTGLDHFLFTGRSPHRKRLPRGTTRTCCQWVTSLPRR